MKTCQFWGRELISSSQKYEKTVWKFSFLAYHFKAELYCYIYIVVFGKHLLELHWTVLSLGPQCIVSQEDFQHKTLTWSNLLPLLFLHTSRAGKRRQELRRLSVNSEAAV